MYGILNSLKNWISFLKIPHPNSPLKFVCFYLHSMLWWHDYLVLQETFLLLFVFFILMLRYCASQVTRIEARSEKFDMFMHLDINSEIYPLKVGQKFALVLVSTLNPDGTPDTGYYTQVINLLSFARNLFLLWRIVVMIVKWAIVEKLVTVLECAFNGVWLCLFSSKSQVFANLCLVYCCY